MGVCGCVCVCVCVEGWGVSVCVNCDHVVLFVTHVTRAFHIHILTKNVNLKKMHFLSLSRMRFLVFEVKKNNKNKQKQKQKNKKQKNKKKTKKKNQKTRPACERAMEEKKTRLRFKYELV